jgi:hypothetical protein
MADPEFRQRLAETANAGKGPRAPDFIIQKFVRWHAIPRLDRSPLSKTHLGSLLRDSGTFEAFERRVVATYMGADPPGDPPLIEMLRYQIVYEACPLPDCYGKTLFAGYVAGWAPYGLRFPYVNAESNDRWLEYRNFRLRKKKAKTWSTRLYGIEESATNPGEGDDSPTLDAQNDLLAMAIDAATDNREWFAGRTFTFREGGFDHEVEVGERLVEILSGEGAPVDVLHEKQSTGYNNGPERIVSVNTAQIQSRDQRGSLSPAWYGQNENCSPFAPRITISTLVHELTHQAFYDRGHLSGGCEITGPGFSSLPLGWTVDRASKHWFCNWMGSNFVDSIWPPDIRRHDADSARGKHDDPYNSDFDDSDAPTFWKSCVPQEPPRTNQAWDSAWGLRDVLDTAALRVSGYNPFTGSSPTEPQSEAELLAGCPGGPVARYPAGAATAGNLLFPGCDRNVP